MSKDTILRMIEPRESCDSTNKNLTRNFRAVSCFFFRIISMYPIIIDQRSIGIEAEL